MADPHFFNLHDLSQGIARDLTDGVRTRIFPGENVMARRTKENEKGSHPLSEMLK